MLQQTQVSRVAERFPRFLTRFPTVRSLAASSLDEVLSEWEGLGYYRRARLLHRAARTIVERHGGRIPSEVSHLRDLPGIGPYTAGAVASIAFGRREAIVDGNVARVLIRLAGRPVAADDPEAVRRCWGEARDLVQAATDPGTLNEAMMELGATVCTPRAPSCEACPVAGDCRARRQGLEGRIPLPKDRARRRRIVHHVLLLPPHHEGRRRLATVRRRPEEGLWASMWEFPTIESPRRLRIPTIAKRLGVRSEEVRPLDRFVHKTTHRDVEFVVLEVAAPPEPSGLGKVARLTLERLGDLAMSVPQRRIADGLAGRWSNAASQRSSRCAGG